MTWHGTLSGMPTLGASAEHSKHVEPHDTDIFAELTGDRNPLHLACLIFADDQ